ncbi:hypothetical protein SAMN03159341_107245 [Paenibacillus sp. 1_12]|nr:hypothetical protein SAMN03159341_107245 [Paenibacillus sp. 1_12]
MVEQFWHRMASYRTSHLIMTPFYHLIYACSFFVTMEHDIRTLSEPFVSLEYKKDNLLAFTGTGGLSKMEPLIRFPMYCPFYCFQER